MFMIVWICIMGLAGLYMFHFHRLMMAKVPKSPGSDGNGNLVTDLNVEAVEVQEVRSSALFKSVSPPKAIESVESVPKFQLPKSKPVTEPEIKHAPAKVLPVPVPEAVALKEQKGKEIKLIRKPKPLPAEKKKLKDMWPMSVADQRQYLQDLRVDDPEPTDKAANEFIAYATEALKSPAPPSMWDIPPGQAERVANSKPGDSVDYHIAGKTVSLPYGFPEESIFILTASYRDPEAASTIARAFAR
jgi:hypothetical protein